MALATGGTTPSRQISFSRPVKPASGFFCGVRNRLTALITLIAHIFAHRTPRKTAVSGACRWAHSRLFPPRLLQHQLVKLRGRTQRGEFLILH